MKLTLERPLVTEKSNQAVGRGEYAFKVDIKASKPEIKKAVEKMFGVKVKKVKTVTMPGKTKRVGKARREIKKESWKKAIVTLLEGQKIELFQTE